MTHSTLRIAAQACATCALTLLVLVLLIGCASEPAIRVVTETEIVEVPVEVVRPLPMYLTNPILLPPPMGDTVTVGSLIDRLIEMYDLLDQANRDRDAMRRLTEEDDGEE